MKVASLIILSLSLYFRTFAAQGITIAFDTTTIPDSLRTDAHSIVLSEKTCFRVKSLDDARLLVHRVVTILKPEGREHGNLYISYDDVNRIKTLKGCIRDSKGTIVRQMNEDDTDDTSAIASFSLFDDNRVRSVELYHDTYPYTVDISYEIHLKQFINWPEWAPVRQNQSILSSHFLIDMPESMPIRYASRNLDTQPVIEHSRGRQTLEWQLRNLPVTEREPWGPVWSEQVPQVYPATDDFVYDGFRGNMSTWRRFGFWYHSLGKGRRELPKEARALCRTYLDSCTGKRDLVRRLYSYIQSNTRYVSIQLGIGGWRPAHARDVHEKRYGDCKGLVNYLQALLEEADVTSFPALIRLGRRTRKIDPGFPSNAFNHVILCVPLENDTLWLDCTSRLLPADRCGAANEDRYALLVTPEGGKLVKSPGSRATDNCQRRLGRINLTRDGSATAIVQTSYSGNQLDRVRASVVESSDRDRMIWLSESLDIPSFRIIEADFDALDSSEPIVRFPISLALPKLASLSGNRLFLPLNLMERWSEIPDDVAHRKHEVRMVYPFMDTDTLLYGLPQGLIAESMPDSVRIRTSFGEFDMRTWMRDDSTLVYIRRLEFSRNRLEAEQYAEFQDFVRTIVRSDRAQAVFRLADR